MKTGLHEGHRDQVIQNEQSNVCFVEIMKNVEVIWVGFDRRIRGPFEASFDETLFHGWENVHPG